MSATSHVSVYRCVHPPDLHSFPTRRSSDLTTVSVKAMRRELDKRAFLVDTVGADRVDRSEEHTSELQSHSDLVCRLLLEKKKKKKIQHTLRTHKYCDDRRVDSKAKDEQRKN